MSKANSLKGFQGLMGIFMSLNVVTVYYLKLHETDCVNEAVWYASFTTLGVNPSGLDIAYQEIINVRNADECRISCFNN